MLEATKPKKKSTRGLMQLVKQLCFNCGFVPRITVTCLNQTKYSGTYRRIY